MIKKYILVGVYYIWRGPLGLRPLRRILLFVTIFYLKCSVGVFFVTV